MFTLSINPTYLCNFKCDFCYLTKDQLSDDKMLDLETLILRLDHISTHREITHVDLYGGEVTVLPDVYIQGLLNIIRQYYDGKINVVTNLSRPLTRTPWLLRDDITLSVSWDYTCREGWDTVMKNMYMIEKPIHLLMLASECMVNWTDETIGAAQMIISSHTNIRSVEIKPYSPNQANQDSVSYSQFEEFVKRWIKMRDVTPPGSYEFVNENLILESVLGQRNAFSDDHIYITPAGDLAVLDFDLNDNEFFLPMGTIDLYEWWAEQEKKRVNSNQFCSQCPYLGHCLSEHLRDVKSLDESCNGFRHLLEWYEGRIQIKTGDVS